MSTTVEQLKNVKPWVEVDLPPFVDGSKLCAKLKKPSLITMMCRGVISNPLMEAAMKVIQSESSKTDAEEPTPQQQADSMEFMQVVARECLVEPTYQEIEEFAGGLTDTQIIAIFKFAMSDTKALEKFCEVPSDN